MSDESRPRDLVEVFCHQVYATDTERRRVDVEGDSVVVDVRLDQDLVDRFGEFWRTLGPNAAASEDD